MRKRRHHYVPQWYLTPWSENQRIYCLRNGQIKPCGLASVGVEKDFYAVSDLTIKDIEFLRRGVIAQSPEGVRSIHESLLREFARVAYANQLKKARPGIKDEAKRTVREIVSNLDENYHESIEHDLQYSIGCMLSGSTEFFSDVSMAGSFLRALALFSLRTKKRREAMKRIRTPIPGVDIDRVCGPMIHMLAINIGGSLLVDRARFRIVLLQNETRLPFITSDQPVINIHENRDSRGTPLEVEWYIPLSPKRAMLYLLAENAPTDKIKRISEVEAQSYNAFMVKHHHDQVFANSRECLSRIALHV